MPYCKECQVRRRTNRTRWQQLQQRIIDFLLDLDWHDVVIAFLLIMTIAFVIWAVHLRITNGGCEEGYIYIQGVCVQGYKP